MDGSSSASGKKRWTFPRFSEADDEKLILEVAKKELLYNLDSPDYNKFLKKEKEWARIGEKLGKSAEHCKKRWKNIRDHYSRVRKEDSYGRKDDDDTEKLPKRKRAHYWDMLSFLNGIEPERRGSRLRRANHVRSNDREDAEDSEASEQNTDNPNTSGGVDVDEESIVNDYLEFDETEHPPMQEISPSFNEARKNTKTCNNVYVKYFKEESDVNDYLEYDKTEHPPMKETSSSFHEDRKTSKTCNNVYVGYLKEGMEGRNETVQCVVSGENAPESDVDLFFRTMAATVKKFTPKQIAEVKIEIFNVVSKVEQSNYS